MTTPLSSILLVLVSSFVGSFGAVFLKLGADHGKAGISGLLTNYRLATGIALYLLSSVFFVMGVARGELTILYPMISLGYIWALVWSRIFFREIITPNKLFGLALIVAGVVCINMGKS
jgi:drug/metabolite transporter (DMT)-like permease